MPLPPNFRWQGTTLIDSSTGAEIPVVGLLEQDPLTGEWRVSSGPPATLFQAITELQGRMMALQDQVTEIRNALVITRAAQDSQQQSIAQLSAGIQMLRDALNALPSIPQEVIDLANQVKAQAEAIDGSLRSLVARVT